MKRQFVYKLAALSLWLLGAGISPCLAAEITGSTTIAAEQSPAGIADSTEANLVLTEIAINGAEVAISSVPFMSSELNADGTGEFMIGIPVVALGVGGDADGGYVRVKGTIGPGTYDLRLSRPDGAAGITSSAVFVDNLESIPPTEISLTIASDLLGQKTFSGTVGGAVPEDNDTASSGESIWITDATSATYSDYYRESVDACVYDGTFSPENVSETIGDTQGSLVEAYEDSQSTFAEIVSGKINAIEEDPSELAKTANTFFRAYEPAATHANRVGGQLYGAGNYDKAKHLLTKSELSALRKGATALRVIGYGVNINSAYQEEGFSGAFDETGRSGFDWAGGAAGAALGAKGGAAIGAIVGAWFGGVGAAPGAVIGAGIGAVAGGIAGSGIAQWAYDGLLSEHVTNAGKWIENTWSDFVGWASDPVNQRAVGTGLEDTAAGLREYLPAGLDTLPPVRLMRYAGAGLNFVSTYQTDGFEQAYAELLPKAYQELHYIGDDLTEASTYAGFANPTVGGAINLLGITINSAATYGEYGFPAAYNEFTEGAFRTLVKTGAGQLGQWGGAIAGGAGGALIGGIGAVPGAIIGGVAGGVLAGKAGDAFAEWAWDTWIEDSNLRAGEELAEYFGLPTAGILSSASEQYPDTSRPGTTALRQDPTQFIGKELGKPQVGSGEEWQLEKFPPDEN